MRYLAKIEFEMSENEMTHVGAHQAMINAIVRQLNAGIFTVNVISDSPTPLYEELLKDND